ncbi:zinc-dependent alcohol dehydrogenase family protein [Microbacterium sp.]|uniref:zinc-dependent alcohol dehydrogenase family protein n=1 Tax=Microbacterium sp. TaxID=51671 RepID=UPI0025F865D0|nr:zinc-dependent alcohol dehydrogenase family protein [Microbacterium sp.]
MLSAAIPPHMPAWVTSSTGDLRLVTMDVPRPNGHDVLIRVRACGVCRTDLHVIDAEIPPHRSPVVPGHQIVGEVVAAGPDATRLRPGALVGVAWLCRTCGACAWCLSGRENLCESATFTGWDRDGGFAPYALADERFAYALPASTDAVATAPLLCAGIIGYRALSRAHLPAGGDLGIYGFGSSGHLTAAVAMTSGARVFAMTRGEENRALARAVGATFVGSEHERPPVPLDAAIVFAPAGELVRDALAATSPGGTVVLAGIHMTDLPAMSYEEHLFRERDLRTVTANTREDGAAFLRLAAHLHLNAHVTRYPFARAADAVEDLRAGRASGSLVIDVALSE